MEITVGSIRRHNLIQVVAGCFGIVGALISSAVMFGFFWAVWWFVTGSVGFNLEDYRGWATPFGAAIVVVVWISGLLRYREGLGGIEYWDSIDTLIPRGETAGAAVVDHYASRVTAPAVVLSGLFVAAPRWLLDGCKRFRRLIPAQSVVAEKMETLRQRLDEVRRWKPLKQYAEVVTELQYLHWMKVAAIGLRDEIPSARISLEHQTSRDGPAA